MSEKFECEECGKEFDSERGLHIHIGSVHPEKKEELLSDEEPDETYECPECGKEFDTERGLHIHQGEVHKDSEDSEESEEADDNKESEESEKKDEEESESIWKKIFYRNPVRAGIAVILVALAIFGMMNISDSSVRGEGMTPEGAGERVVGFLSMNPQISDATLLNSTDTASGVYRLGMEVSAQGTTQKVSYYTTTDGEYLFPQNQETGLDKGTEVTPEEAGKTAAETIEKSISESNSQISNLSVEFTNYTGDVSGVYRINLLYSASNLPSKQATIYVTKDGSMVFNQGLNITEQIEQLEKMQEQQSQRTSFEPEKSETPKVELYVQSFCPYGNQAEESLESVHKLLKDHVDWNHHFILREQNGEITSLHGQVEVDQDARELCVIEEYGIEKWFDFANEVNRDCGQEGECWEEAAETVNISTETVKTCVEERGEELLSAEANKTRESGVTASPTFMVNGEKYSGSRTPEAFKEAVCSGFEEKPEACSTELSTTQGAAQGNC